MKHRFLSLAVLAGIALALLVAAPAQPAAADDSCPAGYDCVDCTRVIPFDPSFCMDVPPGTTPAPDPGMGMSPEGPERVPMPTMPPDMPADPVRADCFNTAQSSPIFASDREGPVYTFVVGVRYCLNRTTGRIVSVTPVVPTPQPNDERVSIFFGPLEKNVTRVPAGGSVAEAIVVYELDVNFFPFGIGGQIQSYHHEVGVRITTEPVLREPRVPPVFELTRVSS